MKSRSIRGKRRVVLRAGSVVAGTLLLLALSGVVGCSYELPDLDLGAVLFEEAFDRGAATCWWDPTAARTENSGDGAVLQFVGPARIEVPQQDYRDYLFQFRICFSSCNCQIVFRTEDFGRYYVVLASRAYLYKEWQGIGAYCLRRVDFAFRWDEWYHVAIAVENSRIRVFVDGELVLEYDDTAAPFLTGGAGWTMTSRPGLAEKGVFVDDIRITEIAGASDSVPRRDGTATPSHPSHYVPQMIPTHERADDLRSACLYREGFESRPSDPWQEQAGWEYFVGHWGDGNTSLLATCDDCRVSFGSPDWGDYALSFKARAEHGGIEILYRVSEVGHYAVLIDGYSKTVAIRKTRGNSTEELLNVRVSRLNPGDIGSVSVCGDGPRLSVYVGGDWVCEWEDTAEPLLAGYAGLGTITTGTTVPYVLLDDILVHETTSLGIYVQETASQPGPSNWPYLVTEEFEGEVVTLSTRGDISTVCEAGNCFLKCEGSATIPLCRDVSSFQLDLAVKLGDAGFSVAFRGDGARSYECRLHPVYAALWRHPGELLREVHPLRPLDPGVWYDVSIAFVHGSIHLSIDGETLAFVQDAAPISEAGDVLITLESGIGSPVCIDNLRLRSPDEGEVLRPATFDEPVGATELFHDTFDHAAAEWSGLGEGMWDVTMNEGEFVLSGGMGGRCQGIGRRDVRLHNGIVELEFQLPAGGFRLNLRSCPEGSYSVGIGTGAVDVTRIRRVDGEETGESLGHELFPFQPERWYVLRLLLDGDALALYVDDVLVWEGSDTDAPLGEGELGLETCPNSSVLVRMIRALELP